MPVHFGIIRINREGLIEEGGGIIQLITARANMPESDQGLHIAGMLFQDVMIMAQGLCHQTFFHKKEIGQILAEGQVFRGEFNRAMVTSLGQILIAAGVVQGAQIIVRHCIVRPQPGQGLQTG